MDAAQTQLLPLRLLRERAGLTLGELARRAGMSKGLLSLWERERYVPTEDERSAVMGILGQSDITPLIGTTDR